MTMAAEPSSPGSTADLVVTGASVVLTCAGSADGSAEERLGSIPGGVVAILEK